MPKKGAERVGMVLYIPKKKQEVKMLENIQKLPSRLATTMDAIMGNGVMRVNTNLVAKHLIPDGNGGLKEAPHPNRLKALMGFHDTRTVRNKCVTTAFVTFICAQLQTEDSTFGDFKWHDSGTGVGVEAVGNTGLGTPCGEARDAGTQSPVAGVYTSVATHTYAGAFAITEHGLFNINAAGTLMDRTLFAAINVAIGDGIQFTFAITFTAGG
jgi:hypothetical protein